MHDVFACYSTPPVTHVPIESRSLAELELNILDALKLAFDDPVSSIQVYNIICIVLVRHVNLCLK